MLLTAFPPPHSFASSLDLSYNRLHSLRGLEVLVTLEELCCEGNRISTLDPCSHLNRLQILRISDNCIENLREVFHLRVCLFWPILDRLGIYSHFYERAFPSWASWI